MSDVTSIRMDLKVGRVDVGDVSDKLFQESSDLEVGRTDEEDASDKLFLGSSDTNDYISSDEESMLALEDNSTKSSDVVSEPLNLCSNETNALCNGARKPDEISFSENGAVIEYVDINLHEEETEKTGYDSSTNICFEEFDAGCKSYDKSPCYKLPNPCQISSELLKEQKSKNGKEESNSTISCALTDVESKVNNCAKRENSLISTDQELQTKNIYGCGSCGKQLSSKSGLRKHRCSQTAYTSTINAESSDDQEELVSPPLKQLRCDWNLKYSRSEIESDLQLHMSSPSEQTYSCNMCGKDFTGQKYLQKHHSIHSDERREIDCSVGDKKIHDSIQYTEPIKTYQDNCPFVCQSCDKSLTQSVDLTQHQSVHDWVENHKCNHCEKVFSDINYLIAHIEADHKGLSNIMCMYCNKQFDHVDAFTNHLKTHSSNNLLECQIREKVFQDTNELQSHLRTHTEKQQSYTNFLEGSLKSYQNEDSHEEHNSDLNYNVNKSLSPRAHNSSKTVGVMAMKGDTEVIPAEGQVLVSGSEEDVEMGKELGETQVAGQDSSEMSSMIAVKVKEDVKEANSRSTCSPTKSNTQAYTSVISHKLYDNTTAETSRTNTFTPLIPDDSGDHRDDLDQVVTLNTPEGVMYQCKVCGYQTRIRQSMLKHSRSHRGKKQSCRLCDIIFTDQYSLQHHYCTNHGEETFVSRGHDLVHNKHTQDPVPQKHRLDPQNLTSNGMLDNSPFHTESSSRQLTQESLSRPASSELSYRCEWCGRSYDKYQLYLDHCMTSHAQRKSYQCLKCHAKFSWRNSLHQHAKFCMNTEIEIYKCDQCPSEFKRKRDLKVHIEGKHGETEKLHTCSCGKTYKWQSGLARHRSKSGCSVEYVIHPSKFRA
ncbi:zinc finger protein 569-like [Ylistrum balloti]|uniref:zinc finger protein 569-like n=1 Tax=Ylistrum balloti TaxID=509963 RepID=UPI0029058717|nr:zinc finger protein 569-like [Ylistrum balloti]